MCGAVNVGDGGEGDVVGVDACGSLADADAGADAGDTEVDSSITEASISVWGGSNGEVIVWWAPKCESMMTTRG